jgi:hypothetical protein
MSNRGTQTLFRGVSCSAILRALTELAPALPPLEPPAHYESRQVEWRIDVAASDTIAVVSQPLYSSGVPALLELCAAAFGCPRLVLDLREGDHWDYKLFVGAEHLHSFSTFPQYWDDDPASAKGLRGDAAELASVWGVPKETVAPYVRNWGEKRDGSLSRRVVLKGKARPGDQFPYGDMYQFLDFQRALGAAENLDKAEAWQSVTVRVPDLVFAPKY